jgi:hypothetical protein
MNTRQKIRSSYLLNKNASGKFIQRFKSLFSRNTKNKLSKEDGYSNSDSVQESIGPILRNKENKRSCCISVTHFEFNIGKTYSIVINDEIPTSENLDHNDLAPDRSSRFNSYINSSDSCDSLNRDAIQRIKVSCAIK